MHPCDRVDPDSWPATWLRPDWPRAEPGIGAVMSTRQAPGGGAPAPGPYADFNLGDHVGDAPGRVAANREALARLTGTRPVWLQQVHGLRVVRLSTDPLDGALCIDGERAPAGPIEADGSWTTEPGLACAVMVADCLPVLLVAPEGRGVAALHAGWRGLCGAGATAAGGIIEVGLSALCQALGCAPGDVQAWLGACIGPSAFEVGPDVVAAFGADPGRPHPRFHPVPGQEGGKWWADLPGLARDRLHALGVRQVAGGDACTVSDPSRFFSFRRDRVTGRMSALVWRR